MKVAVRDHERDRKIVVFREKGGKTFVDIAKKLGISKVRARQVYMRMVKERGNKQLGIGG